MSECTTDPKSMCTLLRQNHGATHRLFYWVWQSVELDCQMHVMSSQKSPVAMRTTMGHHSCLDKKEKDTALESRSTDVQDYINDSLTKRNLLLMCSNELQLACLIIDLPWMWNIWYGSHTYPWCVRQQPATVTHIKTDGKINFLNFKTNDWGVFNRPWRLP